MTLRVILADSEFAKSNIASDAYERRIVLQYSQRADLKKDLRFYYLFSFYRLLSSKQNRIRI